MRARFAKDLIQGKDESKPANTEDKPLPTQGAPKKLGAQGKGKFTRTNRALDTSALSTLSTQISRLNQSLRNGYEPKKDKRRKKSERGRSSSAKSGRSSKSGKTSRSTSKSILRNGGRRGRSLKLPNNYRQNQRLTSWRVCKYEMAKQMPGQINAGVMDGVSPVPVASETFSAGLTISKAHILKSDDLDPAAADGSSLGTSDYLIIACASSMTWMLGAGIQNSMIDTARLGGIQVFQTNEADSELTFLNGFDRVKRCKSFIDVYGSSGDKLGPGSVVWSQAVTMSIIAPGANRTGDGWGGRMTWSQFGSKGFSMNQLINLSNRRLKSDHFVLSTALTNSKMLYEGGAGNNLNSNAADFSQEWVEYAVFLKPAMNVTTGDSAKFALNLTIRGNYCWSPGATDLFLFNVGRDAVLRQGVEDHDQAMLSVLDVPDHDGAPDDLHQAFQQRESDTHEGLRDTQLPARTWTDTATDGLRLGNDLTRLAGKFILGDGGRYVPADPKLGIGDIPLVGQWLGPKKHRHVSDDSWVDPKHGDDGGWKGPNEPTDPPATTDWIPVADMRYWCGDVKSDLDRLDVPDSMLTELTTVKVLVAGIVAYWEAQQGSAVARHDVPAVSSKARDPTRSPEKKKPS